MKNLILVFSIFLAQTTVAENPIKRSDYSHRLNEPVVPGTKVPLEELNTAPNDLELEDRHEKSRFTLRKELETRKKDIRQENRQSEMTLDLKFLLKYPKHQMKSNHRKVSISLIRT